MRSMSPISAGGPVRLDGHEPTRQLRLDDDHRQGMAQQVMEVARDSLTLAERGEPLDLLVRAQETTRGTLAFGVEDAGRPGHDREDEGRREGCTRRIGIGIGDTMTMRTRRPTSPAITMTARRTGLQPCGRDGGVDDEDARTAVHE